MMMRRLGKTFRLGLRHFLASMRALLRQPIFLALTIMGNSVILAGASLLFLIERGVNSKLETPLDALWWAVATVTTVGYGDVHPVTPLGKVMGIAIMLLGTTLFWGFTALFAAVLISPEFREVERSVHRLEEDEAALEAHIQKLQDSLRDLRERPSKRAG